MAGFGRCFTRNRGTTGRPIAKFARDVGWKCANAQLVSRTHLIQFSGTPAERTALGVVLFHITIDRRCRAALRRHGRAVPERACRFVSYLVESGKHLTS